MTQLNYRIELHNGESYLGACRAEEGETHIILPLHGTLRAVTRELLLFPQGRKIPADRLPGRDAGLHPLLL